MGTFNTKSRNHEVHTSLGLNDPSFEGALDPPILSILACILERMIHSNEKLLKKSRKKAGVTVFHGSRAPTLNIRQYIERIYKYSNCSPSCFIVAYVYMDRFIQRTNTYLTSLNAHRLLIASFLAAVKFLEDRCYNNAYFAKIGGVSLAEMNKLELKLLTSLDYRLHVTSDTFDQYCLQMEKEAATGGSRGQQVEWTVQSCGLKGSCLKKDKPKCHLKFAENSCRAM